MQGLPRPQPVTSWACSAQPLFSMAIGTHGICTTTNASWATRLRSLCKTHCGPWLCQDAQPSPRGTDRDKDPVVMVNCLRSLDEVLIKEGGVVINRPIAHYLITRLQELDDWGQTEVLKFLLRYHPRSESETFDLLTTMDFLFRPGAPLPVAIGATCLFLHYLHPFPTAQSDVLERLRAPLLNALASDSSEMCLTVLYYIKEILRCCPGFFLADYKRFFCRHGDPSYVKLVKVEVLGRLVAPDNARDVLTELRAYCTDVCPQVARAAILAIGQMASSHRSHCLTMLKALLRLNQVHISSAVLQACREMVSKHPEYASDVCALLPGCDAVILDTEGRRAILWLLGHCGTLIPSAPYMLENLLESIAQERDTLCKMDFLNAGVRLFLSRPPESQELLGHLLQHSIEEEEDMLVRDRALLYLRLLQAGPECTRHVVCGSDSDSESQPLSHSKLDVLSRGTLSECLLPAFGSFCLLSEEDAWLCSFAADEQTSDSMKSDEIGDAAPERSTIERDAPSMVPSSATPPSQSATPPESLTRPSQSATPPSQSATPPSQSATPPSQSATPPSQSATPPSQSATPPSQSATPPSQSATPPSQSATPPPESLAPQSQSATPPSQSATPPSQSATPPSQAATPPSQAATPPSQAATPPSQAATPPSQAATPPSQAATPPSQAATPPSQAATQPSQSASLPSQSATPPSQSATPAASLAPQSQSATPPEALAPQSQSATPPSQSATPPPESRAPPSQFATPPPASLAPQSQSATPPEALAPQSQSATPPSQSATPPPESLVPPSHSATPPSQSATPPSQPATPPSQSATPPSQSATPPEPLALPSQSATPPESLAPPSQSATPPPESLAPPSQSATPPPESLAPPSQSVTPPPESLAPPSQSATPPPESLAPPSQSAAPPSQSATVPSQSAAPPSPSPAPPLESLVPPLQSAAPPPESLVPPSYSPATTTLELCHTAVTPVQFEACWKAWSPTITVFLHWNDYQAFNNTDSSILAFSDEANEQTGWIAAGAQLLQPALHAVGVTVIAVSRQEVHPWKAYVCAREQRGTLMLANLQLDQEPLVLAVTVKEAPGDKALCEAFAQLLGSVLRSLCTLPVLGSKWMENGTTDVLSVPVPSNDTIQGTTELGV
uniref:AP-4 complex subunit beta-1 isoform X2 n=1 Tax=Myxine glutinosa TaxID=7769 RepID=UPI00358F396F